MFFIIVVVFFAASHSVYAEWEYVDSGVSEHLLDVAFSDELHGWAVGKSSTIIATVDGGWTWNRQTCPVEDVRLTKLFFVNESVGYIVGYSGTILSTKDGGETWIAYSVGDDCYLNDVFFLDENTGWIACAKDGAGPSNQYGIIFHTIDGGETWETQFDTSSFLTGKDYFDGIEFINKDNGWALGGQHFDNLDHTNVYRTYDGGNNWDVISRIRSPRRKISVVAPDTLWVSDYRFARSFNGGLDWEYSGSDLESISGEYLDICQIDGLKGWAVSHVIYKNIYRIFSTDNGGNTWTEEFFSDDFFFLSITNVGRNIVCAVGKSGLVVIKREKPSGIDIEEKNSPQAFQLHENHPNPFNPSTTLSYFLPKTSNVKLYVYNSNGQKVATLVDSHMSAGEHSAKFDGRGLASGMYFYRFEAGGFEKSGKMILVK
jgi:photosystem II stability/assembly factor-like uncharacterized protein